MTIKLSDFIKTYDNALSNEFCKNICKKFDNDKRISQGVTGVNPTVNKSFKDTMDLNISTYKSSGWYEEDKILYENLQKHLKKYFDDIHKSCKNYAGKFFGLYNNIAKINDSGYMVMRYEATGHFDWHDDFQVEKNLGARVLTFIWYLNDADKQGCTEFCDGTLVEPKTGRLLIFPAEWIYLHRGKTPKVGRKYICTGWLYFQS